MRKIFLSLVLVLSFLSVFALGAAALDVPVVEDKPLLYDEARLLNEEDFASVESKLASVSDRIGADVVVITVNSLADHGYYGNEAAKMFAADFFYDNGYGRGGDRDGTALIIAMAERDFTVVTHGYGITALSDYGVDWLCDRIAGDLTEANYKTAFRDYADYVDNLFDRARKGDIFDVGSDKEPVKPFSPLRVIGSVLTGFLGGLIPVSGMKSQLKTVRQQAGARSYAKGDSVQVTGARDYFVGRNVARTPRASESSGRGHGGSTTFHSSSGGTFGGGSTHKF